MHPAVARPAWRRRDRVRAAASRDGLLPSAGPVLMFLLDTNVLSELRRRKRIHPKVAAWADSAQADDHFHSVTTMLEIEAGTLMPARRDAARGAVLRAGFDDKVLPAFAGRTPAIDTPVANQRRRASRTGTEDLLARRHHDGTATAQQRHQPGDKGQPADGSRVRRSPAGAVKARQLPATSKDRFTRGASRVRGAMEKKRRRLKVLSPASKGHLFTRDGDLKIRTARHKADASPLVAKCSCTSPRRLHPARWQRIGRLQPRLSAPPGPLRRDAGPDAGQHPQPAQLSRPDA